MTRVVYLPNPHTITIFESAEAADGLAERLRSGEWALPMPAPDGMDVQVLQFDETILVIGKTNMPSASRRLTTRQAQVLDGIMQGMTIQQIALLLRISPRTASYHASQLKQRLGADTLAQAVARVTKSEN